MNKIENIREIQLIGLNTLKFIDDFCKKNDIKYSLCAGTALGAIRHKGFIPWDDDIDIMMTRDNYNKFLDAMSKNKNLNYSYIHAENSCFAFAKVVDNNTIVEIDNIKDQTVGLFVDIFPIDNMNEQTMLKDVKKVNRLHSLAFLSATKKFKKSPHGFISTVIKFFIRPITKLFGTKYWVKKAEKQKTKYNSIDCKYAGVYDEYLDREIFEKEMFNNLIYVDFEDSKFPIIEQYDKYLTQIYGDYMTPPPKDKQIAHPMKVYKKEQS